MLARAPARTGGAAVLGYVVNTPEQYVVIELDKYGGARATEGADLLVEVLGRGFAWLNTGTHASLVEASHFVQILEQRQGLRIACPEEIALRLGYISLDQFHKLAQKTAKSSYGEYLKSVARSLSD